MLSFTVLGDKDRRDWEDEEFLARELSRLDVRSNALDEGQYPPLRLRPGTEPIRIEDWPRARFRGPLNWPFAAGVPFGWQPRDRERLTRALVDEEGR